MIISNKNNNAKRNSLANKKKTMKQNKKMKQNKTMKQNKAKLNNTKSNTNQNIIQILTLVKNHYASMKNTIHVNAYERAIYQINKFPNTITSGEQLKHLVGIGKGMIEKINTILATGTLPIIKEKGLGNIGKHIGSTEGSETHNIASILGFGEKLEKQLIKEYNARNINDIRKLVAEGKIKLTHAQELGVKYYEDLGIKIPRDEIGKIGDDIKRIVAKHNVDTVLAGSYPSGAKKESKDIDIILVGYPRCISLPKLVEEIKVFHKMEIFSLGTTKFLGLMQYKSGDGNPDGKWRHIDIRYVEPDVFPYCWLYYSSGKVFNKLIREKLKKKGYKLNEWGLFKDDRKVNLGVQNISNETDVKRLSKKSLFNKKWDYEELMQYTEKIEKEIFKIAELEYMDVKERY